MRTPQLKPAYPEGQEHRVYGQDSTDRQVPRLRQGFRSHELPVKREEY